MTQRADADRAVWKFEADVATLLLVDSVRNARRERLLEDERSQ
mgnify:CR=1 FL=1